MVKFVLVFVLLFVFAIAVPVKHLAGPPEEFKNHLIPNPRDTLTVEKSHSEKIVFDLLGHNVIYEQDIPVDGPSDFQFMFASPYEDLVTLQMTDPTGNSVDLDSHASISPVLVSDEDTVNVTAYTLTNTVRGIYKLTVTKKAELSDEKIRQLREDNEVSAIVTVLNNDYVQMESHMSSYMIRAGNNFGLVARVIDTNVEGSPVNIHVSSANMIVTNPNGQDITLPMKDDGTDGDEIPGDGWYTAVLSTPTGGEYIATATMEGNFNGAGITGSVVFKRSTQHVISVSSATTKLLGTASLRNLDTDRYAVDIGATSAGIEPTLRAYAEVWGIQESSKLQIPVCWIGGIVEIGKNSNGQFITLELNKNWLVRAGVTGPLTLRNVYLSDLSTSFPIDKIPSDINVQNSGNNFEIAQKIHKYRRISKNSMKITKEMLFGVNPLDEVIIKENSTADNNLVLLPGYCSSNNPFIRTKETFPTGVFYIGQKENLKNDDYAKKIMAWIETQSVDTFGLIGHSQGGMVSLHIRNYYFTGLDGATGGRLIQSVGTPYKGSSASGWAAELGKLFGIGCGSQSDLSHDGAINWLSGISDAARKDVYFYTTTFKTDTILRDFCSLAMNLILKAPNDGTTELDDAILDGGNNMGNAEKWCHAQNMGYPPQSDDISRNTEMNANAAH